jgi:hypothetical protein
VRTSRIEGGGGGVLIREIVLIVESERLPRGTMSVQEAAAKGREALRIHLALVYAAKSLVYALSMN